MAGSTATLYTVRAQLTLQSLLPDCDRHLVDQRARSLPLALVSSRVHGPPPQRRQEQKPVWLSGSLISQKTSMAIEDKRRHHGEHRTPKQGLYSVSTTTNQGRDPPRTSRKASLTPPLVRRAEAGLPSVCSSGQILSRIP
jgi:hypothetical protein